MSRFCLSRKWISSLNILPLLVGGVCLATPSPSYADTSWVDILKPLVKDVIVPGANAGMKKLLEKKLKVNIDPSQAMNAVNNLNSNDTVMSMPEEPTASSSTSGSDSVMSMPEEPTYSASSTGSSDSTLSAPPPPVSTP